MSNKLISIGLMLVLMWPLTAGDGKRPAESYNGPTKDMTTLRSIPGVGQNLTVFGSSVNYDADVVAYEEDAMPAYSPSGFGRGTADTLAYMPADGGWNAYFYGYQAIGDAFMTAFQMPADGVVKGINVPVYFWGTGEQQITFSLHKLSYPVGTDGAEYSTASVDGSGWLGGYDMDASGWMTISGTDYSAGGTAGVCNPASSPVIAAAQDPLGTTDGTGPAGTPTKGLIWPDGFNAVTANPESHPAEQDNWYATIDFGTEPTLMAGDWVGVLANATGAGGGSDPTLGFYYEAADGLVDNWVGLKFYGECGGTSGNGGWHIRHWMFKMELAVELTGDRGPVIGSVTPLPTTLSTDARALEVHVTDDNPSGEAAGVSSVTLTYQLDSLTATVNSVALSMTDGTSEDGTWAGDMPGASTGQTVYWSLTAYDNNGNATSTAVKSYFIFQATAGAPLLFDNSAALYGVALYAPYCYYGWGQNPFDYWSRDYGNVNDELFANYSVVFERASDGADYDTDAVANPWYQSGDKVYIAEGDEWLGTRYGWPAEPMELEEGSFARHLGVGVYTPDINGPSTAISRMVPNADDALGAVMADYLDSNVVTMLVDSTAADTSAWDTTYTYASSNLYYDPNYDPGHLNWLDQVDPHAGAHAAYSAYPGDIDSLGNAAADAELVPVAVYAQHGSGSRGGMIAFDQMSLYARVYNDTGAVTYSHWVGPEDYYSDLPGGLVKGMMDWAAGTASIDDEVIATPETFSLKGNYPNPFNPSTNIMFTMGMENDVTVSVYSILGEEIATLHSGRMIPGTHSIRWNGLTSNGYNVASGVYFYQVNVAGQVKTGKMMLLK